MATQTIQRHCATCQGPRPFDRPGTSHILHLLLTVFTAGLWLLVWVPLMLLGGGGAYHCRYCGGRPALLGLSGKAWAGWLFLFLGAAIFAVLLTVSGPLSLIGLAIAALGLQMLVKAAKKKPNAL